LRGQGFTEFLSELIPFTYGVPPGITFATTAPGGFTDEQIALLRAVPPLLAAPLEVRAQRLTTGAILDTYLGRGPSREVLHGAIRRGDLRRIDCAVLLTDLRGFTGKTEGWPPETLLHALDIYFEAVADAVSTAGGDVIKFLGDGVLAIFPVEAAGNTAAACKAALNAALQARDALKASNDGRSERGEEPLDFGCGLHIGEVAYGNIGGRDRLDFTVIGAAVKVASRCRSFARPRPLPPAHRRFRPACPRQNDQPRAPCDPRQQERDRDLCPRASGHLGLTSSVPYVVDLPLGVRLRELRTRQVL
jgi:adenylate cyclase